MATKRVFEKQEADSGSSTKKLRELSGLETIIDIDVDLKVLIEQDKMRHENEAKRLHLEERKLALQEKQFKHDAEERRATADLLRALIQTLNSKK